MKRIFNLLLLFCCSKATISQNCVVICNGNFDNPSLTTSVGLFTVVNCWSTFATDGKFEIWGSGFQSVPAYQGIQFMELNATQGATVYQDFNVGANVPLSVGFAHRGRAGIDTMEVFMGPVGGPYTSLGRYGDGNSAWGYYTANYTTGAAGMYRMMFDPVYWSGGNIAIGNFLDAVTVEGGAGITLNVTSTVICSGGTVSLLASGATSYSWTNGPATALYTVAPQGSTVYTVTATNSLGCSGSRTVDVTVKPNPQINVSATKTLLCKADKPAVITATGGVSYQWTGGPNTATISSGANTATYVVTGTGTNGCQSSASIVITIRLCEGVADHEAFSTLRIYPNPAEGQVTLYSEVDEQLRLFNVTGQLVMDIHLGASNARTAVLRDLEPGVYFVTGNDARRAQKFVVK